MIFYNGERNIYLIRYLPITLIKLEYSRMLHENYYFDYYLTLQKV